MIKKSTFDPKKKFFNELISFNPSNYCSNQNYLFIFLFDNLLYYVQVIIKNKKNKSKKPIHYFLI